MRPCWPHALRESSAFSHSPNPKSPTCVISHLYRCVLAAAMPALRAFLSSRATRARGHWVFVSIIFALLGSNGRLLSTPAALDASERLHHFGPGERGGLMSRLVWWRRRRGPEDWPRMWQAQQQQQMIAPTALEGAWRWIRPPADSEKSRAFDRFLDRAVGVGYLKRSLAIRASQDQELTFEEDKSLTLKVIDRRGTNTYTIRPDYRVHSSRGFGRLPIKQRAKWLRDGSLWVEETYAQHLGGSEHGRPCVRIECPTFRQRRSVDADGRMVVELERTLRDGETVRMTQHFEAI